MSASPALRRFRVVLWALVALAALLATALFFFRPVQRPLALNGTPFSLQTTTGAPFTQNDLVGKPSLVFFGYTFCPDVCPTTLAESLAWKQALGISDEELRTIFVTVDPERDTPETLAAYLGGFDPDVIGLSGDPAQTEAAKSAFGVTAERNGEAGDPYYLVNHTASMFLVDAQGRFHSTIAYGEDRETALAKISRLMGA